MTQIIPTILALSCSPSQGRNSDTMLDSFIEGIKAKGGVMVEKIYLKDIPIEYCCFENRNGPQEHEQAFRELTEKIKHAQGLIIATPTYNFSVPAHLKNFIDRLRFFALDMEHRNKLNQPPGMLEYLKTYFIVSGGTPLWAQRILFFAFPPFWLRSVFLYYGSIVYGAFYSGDVQTFSNAKILLKCKKEGTRYAQKIVTNSSQSVLEKLFWRPPQRDAF